ncbi:MAG: hypothetical protein ACUVQF_09765 [Fervidobacterium sp.]|uniref:hypothetical protein n=1 Tax=Fervidobacterium sp. TaxID=1871331 RepID=UPI004048FD3B
MAKILMAKIDTEMLKKALLEYESVPKLARELGISATWLYTIIDKAVCTKSVADRFEAKFPGIVKEYFVPTKRYRRVRYYDED